MGNPLGTRGLKLGRRTFAALAVALAAAWPSASSAGVSMADVRKKLDLAERTLELVERTEARPELSKRLAALAAKVRGGGGAGALLAEVGALRREIIFSHPALGFERLLVNRNPPPLFSHNCDQYLGRHSRRGKGITILSDWKSSRPGEKVILADKLPPGAVNKPKLSWDGERLVFAFCDHTEKNASRRRYLIHEGALDGSWVRQITGTSSDPMERWDGRETVLIEDNDPCYLPGGGVAFVSSRCQGFGRCHNGRYTPSFLLYRAERDGSDIRQISFGEANETDPVTLRDGRVVFTRWDYINRNVTKFHMLWWTRPDGTNVSNFYGSNTEKPWMISEAVPVPKSPMVVALATGHHSFSTGTIIRIDPRLGEDGAKPVKRVTPEVGYFEAERWKGGGCYSTPWPLTEDIFLAAWSPSPIPKQGRKPPDDYAIYLVDTLGGRELVYRDADGMSSFSPTPLAATPRPIALPSSLPDGERGGTGVLYIEDVYQNRHDPKGSIARGEIKALRVNEMINQPAVLKNNGAQPSMVRHEVPKKILGTVPVLEDGSAHFLVPAGRPLQLQALDERGMAVMTMRTFIYLHPGETRGCVGCHEPRGNTPTPRNGAALRRAPSRIEPPRSSSYEGGLSYMRTVQPVLDRHCIRCHGLGGPGVKPKGGVDLTGVREKLRQPKGFMKSQTGPVPRSYNTLFNRRGLLAPARFKAETNSSKPRDYFAAASKLTKQLLKGHSKVKLSADELRCVFDWMDLNFQLYGGFSWNRIEARAADTEGEKALRAHVRELFGDELAGQPYETLVNAGDPAKSRILLAPLAGEAGGWGQLKPLWPSADDPRRARMRKLVEASIRPLEFHDVNGNCGRARQGGKCICRSCWVKEAEDAYRPRPSPTAGRE